MSSACITANPDISGIGVRAAIYAQNLLCFLPVWAYLRDGTISPDEMKGVKDQSIGMLAIAFAILISTIVQATTAVSGQQISRFHAAVILDLSWMNNTSTWIWFLLYAHHLSNDDNRTARRSKLHRRCPRCRLQPGRKAIPATASAWAPLLFSEACDQHAWGAGSVVHSPCSNKSFELSAAAACWPPAWPIALGTLLHARLYSCLAHCTSRSCPPLEFGCGWIHSNLAYPSAALRQLLSWEGRCLSRHSRCGNFRWRCILSSSYLLPTYSSLSSFFLPSISPTIISADGLKYPHLLFWHHSSIRPPRLTPLLEKSTPHFWLSD
ncbi:hypothetical protein DFH06DRAFT_559633 [Mycena polygramma]|nr:hypothetical protein DFH06DRAFT_559633 [Mycena polygramma]